jgi:hypothetical protein
MQSAQEDSAATEPAASRAGSSADLPAAAGTDAQPLRRRSIMQHISFELALANGLGSVAIAGTLQTVLALVRHD